MASPVNQHCASCICALSFPVVVLMYVDVHMYVKFITIL